MKITKEILDYFEENVINDDPHYIGNFEKYSERDVGQQITWEMLRQQILQHQAIVEKLNEWVKEDFLSDGAIGELRDVGLDIGNKKLLGETSNDKDAQEVEE